MTQVQEIKRAIEKCLDDNMKIALFPFGDIGLQTKLIMKEVYGIEPAFIFDNHICNYNSQVLSLSEAESLELEDVIFIFTIAEDNKSRKQLLDKLIELNAKYIELDFTQDDKSNINNDIVGRHSYGDIIKNSIELCESIGGFCSFAEGTRVVQNHANQYISTSPFIYHDRRVNDCIPEIYEEYRKSKWYIEGIKLKGKVLKSEKTKIGNDVWLGRNVTITNGANIGNGVIAGAGAVITKDVPDYAIVMGVPAKIIKYRYSPGEIDALNRICWWNWSDDQIRERYDDFFLPIKEFIKKYDK